MQIGANENKVKSYSSFTPPEGPQYCRQVQKAKLAETNLFNLEIAHTRSNHIPRKRFGSPSESLARLIGEAFPICGPDYEEGKQLFSQMLKSQQNHKAHKETKRNMAQ